MRKPDANRPYDWQTPHTLDEAFGAGSRLSVHTRAHRRKHARAVWLLVVLGFFVAFGCFLYRYT